MNVKTTLLLALVFALLVLGLVSLRKSTPADVALPLTPQPVAATVTRNLFADPLGNIVKITVQRKNGDEWLFEKKDSPDSPNAPVWFMTKPIEMKTLTYEVDRIGREAGRIQYDIAFKEGETGAVTTSAAGLTSPEATVTLTDDADKTETVQIGYPVSESETYVRLAGDDQIVVAKNNLRNLLKDKPLDYRDQQLWNFSPEDATRVEIVDRSTQDGPTTYMFARDSGRWMMESPTTARATGKVDEFLRSFSRMRVAKWEDDDATKLPVYGLDSPALAIKVTVEQTVPVKKDTEHGDSADNENDNAAEEEPLTEKKTSVHELLVSDRSPIGEESKVYVRVADESTVATVFKSTTDKFKPVMAEWRDMDVASVDATKANRVDLMVAGESASLLMRDEKWVFESDAAPAEQHAVVELLAAIKGLKAVAFAESPDARSAAGFDNPQADIRLTIPGVEGVQRFTVGTFTDPTSRRLVYLQYNEGATAKVKSDDVAPLLRSTLAYRDRTILDLPSAGIRQITLSRANSFTGSREKMTLEHGPDLWSMTAPVLAPVRDDQVKKLAASLASLKAESVTAEGGEASAFGLHDPAVIVTLTYQPKPTARIEETSDEDGDAETTVDASESPDEDVAQPSSDSEEGDSAAKPHAIPVEVEQPAQHIELVVTEHDGKHYARRKDRDTIYEVSSAFFDELNAEFRMQDVLDFEPGEVQELSIKNGDQTLPLARSGPKWTFKAEPDLPIDSARVEKLLTDLRDLKTERYATNASADLSAFGLEAPQYQLTLVFSDEKTRTVSISERKAAPSAATSFFALSNDHPGVFLLDEQVIPKLFVSLGDLEKK